ncbi:MAG: type II toxin-antitoxin system RelE/ParE family toxin [Gammaproteobacteria bacterium]
MFTVIESPLFQKLWPMYWTEEERGEFAAYIAAEPAGGAVIRESGGLRKVRWSRPGSGKSGGVRVIYFTRTEQGEVMLVTLFAKGNTGNIPAAKLKEIRRALEI